MRGNGGERCEEVLVLVEVGGVLGASRRNFPGDLMEFPLVLRFGCAILEVQVCLLLLKRLRLVLE
jgi:hypothetical protein